MSASLAYDRKAYFSGNFLSFGVVLCGVAVWMIYKEVPLGALLLLPIILLLLTTRRGFEIDREKNYVNNYVSIFGLKYSNKRKYNKVERIFLNTVQISQTMNSYGGRRSTITDELYQVNVIIDGENIAVYESKNEEKAVRKAKEIAKFLNVELEDLTITQ